MLILNKIMTWSHGRSEDRPESAGPLTAFNLIVLNVLVMSMFIGAGASANDMAATNAPAVSGEITASDASPQLRDPFWPISYVPPSMAGRQAAPVSAGDREEGGAAPKQAAGAASLLRIGGVVKQGNRYYVTINGFAVQTGEVVTAFFAGEAHRFVVEKIDLKKIEIKPLKRQ